MGAFSAFREGIRRVNGAPAVVLGVSSATFLVALPLALALQGMLEAHLGKSLAAGRTHPGAVYEWWQEFASQAAGLGTTFSPSITGFGAVLDNVSGLLDNTALAATIAGVTAAWMLLWSFLSGGIIDRLARNRRTRSSGFFAACGVHFWRFARLGVFAWLVYYFLFGWVHGWIFTDLYTKMTRDLTVERTAFLIRLAGYLLFGMLLVFFNVIFDYARIRIVVEDRRSAIGAIAAAARFVRRHAGRVFVVYVLNTLAFGVLIAAYAAFSLLVPRTGGWIWAALFGGQAFIVGRHYLKLLFYASETALFQGALAHAAYTAAPPLVWPDSPAAESIANAEPAALP